MLCNKNYDCKSIYCSDKYGDYGLIGFCCLSKKDNKLIHFLFSCRTLGMHIEQYVYQLLGFPNINVIKPVTIELTQNSKIDYIFNIRKKKKKKKNKTVKRGRTLIVGPCDLETVVQYLKGNDIDTEFRFCKENGDMITYGSHSAILCNALDKINTTNTPLFDPIVYNTKIFSNKYNVIIFSVLVNILLGEYENKKTGEHIIFGENFYDATTKEGADKFLCGEAFSAFRNLEEKDFQQFAKDYNYIGRCSVDVLVSRIEKIVKNISTDCKVFILLGSEKKCNKNTDKHPSLINADVYSIKLNRLLEEKFKDSDNVFLVNPTKYIIDDNSYNDNIQHYTREVYYNIAKEIAEKSDKIKSRKNIKGQNKLYVFFRRCYLKMRQILKRIFK